MPAPTPGIARRTLFAYLFAAMVRLLTARNLRADRFGTLASIAGVALGTATVEVVLVLDVNTRQNESSVWTTNPDLDVQARTVALRGVRPDGTPTVPKSVKQETHEDYEVMRSAIRLGSLSAFLVGALIVFFTFGAIAQRRAREVALLRSLGALPGQVGAVFVREALIVGALGALLGFVAAIPMSAVGARMGLTTTGRSHLSFRHLAFPWASMALVSTIGAVTALLGVLRPLRDVLRLDAASALRPRFLSGQGASTPARSRGVTLIALPFAMLVYILLRPFFRSAIPTLAFFVLEAAMVCVAFLATIVLVPELVRILGGVVARLIPATPTAERLLAQRRLERAGDELAWSVSGVMLVFALLLTLHIAVHALQREAAEWADSALGPYTFVLAEGAPRGVAPYPGWAPVAKRIGPLLPDDAVVASFSSLTPWPNLLHAVAGAELAAVADTTGKPAIAAMARRLGPGKILLSRLMAQRHRVLEGDSIEVSGRGGTRRLEIIGITDEIGYTAGPGPYRNAKTYGVVDAADFDLIAPYAAPIGAVAQIAGAHGAIDGDVLRTAIGRSAIPDLRTMIGRELAVGRVRETGKDFLIFDAILALTTTLAAVGIANQLLLGVRARRREIALYRVLGMTAGDVRKLVLYEGAFIGVIGGALAAALGVPLGYAAVGALRAVSAFDVRLHVPPMYIVSTILGATAVAMIASILPASRAGTTDAAESVHYE